MSNKIYGRVYLITNKINGKLYVGQTTQTLKERFAQHINESKDSKTTMPIAKAINKYGVKNFKIKKICNAYSQQELNTLEGKYMAIYKTLNRKFGYNIKIVDINGNVKLSEVTKRKISKKVTKIMSDPKRKKVSSEIGKRQRGKTYPNSSSKYTGVSIGYKNLWNAHIRISNKKIHLGTYNTEMEAAQSRDIEELKYSGDNAILNFPTLKDKYLTGEIRPVKIDGRKNLRLNKKSNSNVVGVSFKKSNKRWQVRLKGFKHKYFKTKEEAESYALECHTFILPL